MPKSLGDPKRCLDYYRNYTQGPHGAAFKFVADTPTITMSRLKAILTVRVLGRHCACVHYLAHASAGLVVISPRGAHADLEPIS